MIISDFDIFQWRIVFRINISWNYLHVGRMMWIALLTSWSNTLIYLLIFWRFLMMIVWTTLRSYSLYIVCHFVCPPKMTSRQEEVTRPMFPSAVHRARYMWGVSKSQTFNTLKYLWNRPAVCAKAIAAFISPKHVVCMCYMGLHSQKKEKKERKERKINICIFMNISLLFVHYVFLLISIDVWVYPQIFLV